MGSWGRPWYGLFAYIYHKKCSLGAHPPDSVVGSWLDFMTQNPKLHSDFRPLFHGRPSVESAIYILVGYQSGWFTKLHRKCLEKSPFPSIHWRTAWVFRFQAGLKGTAGEISCARVRQTWCHGWPRGLLRRRVNKSRLGCWIDLEMGCSGKKTNWDHRFSWKTAVAIC